MKFIAIIALMALAGCAGPAIEGSVIAEGEPQIVFVGMDAEGYTPKEITVEAGHPVILKNDGTIQGCGLQVVQPELGIEVNFANSDSVEFLPEKKGEYTLSCSMGMWHGKIIVV